MHKIQIKIPVEYIMGHLRYGHYEGIIDLTDEEYEKFKKSPKDWIESVDGLSYLNFVIDDYRIDDIGPIEEVQVKEDDANDFNL
jgi:hypothetical protein